MYVPYKPRKLLVSAVSGVTTEAGATFAFTVALSRQPAANVTVSVVSSDTTEGTVAPSSLTFTPVNWETPQTVTVTGVDDGSVDGPIGYRIDLTAASADPKWQGETASVGMTNTDNDVPAPPADLRPRFALGAATIADLTAFLAGMTPIAGSADDSVTADFVVPTQTISQYGWLATTATADAAATLTAPSGRPKFYASLAGNTTSSQTIEEGWNGAGATGPGVGPGGSGADNKLTATISGVIWNFRRQVFPGNTSDTWFTRR